MAGYSASESTAVVRVLVVDDQRLFRRAAAALVRSVDEFKLVGEAETGEQPWSSPRSCARSWC